MLKYHGRQNLYKALFVAGVREVRLVNSILTDCRWPNASDVAAGYKQYIDCTMRVYEAFVPSQNNSGIPKEVNSQKP
jgi:hypothetical protein